MPGEARAWGGGGVSAARGMYGVAGGGARDAECYTGGMPGMPRGGPSVQHQQNSSNSNYSPSSVTPKAAPKAASASFQVHISSDPSTPFIAESGPVILLNKAAVASRLRQTADNLGGSPAGTIWRIIRFPASNAANVLVVLADDSNSTQRNANLLQYFGIADPTPPEEKTTPDEER